MKNEKRFHSYTPEGLTRQNMRTLKNGENIADFEALHHDVTLMNERQLARYMKLSFLGHRDAVFLPPTFWRDAFGGDHSAPKFFGGTAGFVGRVCYLYPQSTDEAEQSWVGYPIHVEYRLNLRSALTQIFAEATWADHPTQEQKELAIGAVETVGYIAQQEGYGQGFPDDAQNQPLFRLALTMLDAMHHEPTFVKYIKESQYNNLHQFIIDSTYRR